MTTFKFLPLISVIIPIFNGADFLPKAIESELNQTYKNFEIIIFDHGASGNTRFIIRKYEGVKYFYPESTSLALERNIGIQKFKRAHFVFWIQIIGWRKMCYSKIFYSKK